VLVARNASKLLVLALKLKEKYAIKVQVFAANLIPVGAAQALFEKITSKEITINV
jgi:short-subunit dehydrogenase